MARPSTDHDLDYLNRQVARVAATKVHNPTHGANVAAALERVTARRDAAIRWWSTRCRRCARPLSRHESLEAGIGPCCAEREEAA